MYGDVMVRKQLYITEGQEEELKRRAAETGMTEAEVVRRALDLFFNPIDSGAQRKALDAFNEDADRLVEILRARVRAREGDRPLVPAMWSREELYAERTDRYGSR